MAERSLSDIFKKVAPSLTGRHKEIFDKATEVKVKIDRENRIAEVSITLPEIYKKHDIYSLENIIKEKYELKNIMILTHYSKKLFSVSYMSEVFTEAARVGIIINGFFDKYDIEMDNDVMNIYIPFSHGGITLLDLAKTAHVIEGIITSEFGINLTVNIKQSSDAEEQYAEFVAHQLVKLNSETENIIAEHDKLEEMAKNSEAKQNETEEKPVLPRVASLFEGADTS